MDQRLKDFGQALSESRLYIHRINAGGCAKAAYAFYKHFLPNSNIKVKGAMILNWNSFYSNKKSVTNLAKNKRQVISYCNHVVLVFEHDKKQYIIDSVDGIMLKSDYIKQCNEMDRKVITGYLKPKLLRKIAKSKNGWNDAFNVYDLKHLRKFLKENPLNV